MLIYTLIFIPFLYSSIRTLLTSTNRIWCHHARVAALLPGAFRCHQKLENWTTVFMLSASGLILPFLFLMNYFSSVLQTRVFKLNSQTSIYEINKMLNSFQGHVRSWSPESSGEGSNLWHPVIFLVLDRGRKHTEKHPNAIKLSVTTGNWTADLCGKKGKKNKILTHPQLHGPGPDMCFTIIMSIFLDSVFFFKDAVLDLSESSELTEKKNKKTESLALQLVQISHLFLFLSSLSHPCPISPGYWRINFELFSTYFLQFFLLLF